MLTYILSTKDFRNRKRLVENKKKDKEVKKLVHKIKQDSRYFCFVLKNHMRQKHDFVY